MRIKIEFTKPKELIVDNQHLVNGFIHNLLGRNNKYHDSDSKYNVSQLMGGRLDKETRMLKFTGVNPFIIVSSMDMDFINNVVKSLINKPSLTTDCTFKDMSFISETINDNANTFLVLSPILLKDRDSNRFHTIKDLDYSNKLKEQTLRKLNSIDPSLDLTGFDLTVLDKPLNKTKIVKVRNVYNYASICNVRIKGTKKVMELLYNVGLGNSTGSGFGTIYKTYDLYKF